MVHPKAVQILVGLSAAISFIFTGATLSWPSPAIPKFKSGEAGLQITDTQTSWVISLLGLGAVLGCYCGQQLSERIGRRPTILCAGVPGLIGASIITVTGMPELMYVARLLIGCSTGTLAVVIMIYITEIADKDIRGALGMVVQVMNNLGGLIVYGIGPFVSYTALNLIVLSIPILFILVCLWIPESPYYYLKEEKIESARKSFVFLNGSKNEKWIDDQLGVMKAHVREQMENKSTVKELFQKRYRKTLYIVAGLKVMQYMTGSLVIQVYLEMIFRQSSSISGPLASIVYGFVQLLAGIAATFLSRWFGRRPLMLTSSIGVALSLTAIGSYFFLQDFIQATPDTMSSLSFLPIIGILSFNILYTIGLGNLPYVMQVELFPINIKAVASSVATMAASIFTFLVTKSYQSIKDMCGHYTVFWVFAGVGYLGVFFIYFCVPETKGKTLEQVQDDLEDQGLNLEVRSLRSEEGNRSDT